MASGGKGRSGIVNSLLIWRIVLVVTLLACASLAGLFWMSSSKETEEAMAAGRRLMVSVATGDISGNQLTLADLQKPQEPAASEEPPSQAMPDSGEPGETTEPAAEPVPPQEPQADPQASPESPDTTEPEVELPETEPSDPATPATSENPQQPGDESEQKPADPAAAGPQEQSSTGEMSVDPSVPVVPQPLTYEELPHLPAQPADQSNKPAVLPVTAPAPPLQNQPVTAIVPAAEKLAGINRTLTEAAGEGLLPVIAPDGTRAWRYYARPHVQREKKPMIAIVITGLGYNKTVSEHAIRMNGNITLSFSPYVRELDNWTSSARLTGHEIMLDLPMEPANYPAADPGPHGLLVAMGPEENESRLRWLMARMPNSIGFTTPWNEGFSASTNNFKLLMQSLSNRGLMMVITREPSKDETKEILNTTTTPNVVADMLLDEELSETAIQARFTAMEQLATQRGYAVGIAQPYPLTIAQLQSWVETLEARGFVLVPVSAIARLDYS